MCCIVFATYANLAQGSRSSLRQKCVRPCTLTTSDPLACSWCKRPRSLLCTGFFRYRQHPSLRLSSYTYMTTMESSKPICHVSLATAESVVRSSQSDIDETLMRSHLERERGFVNERQTCVCPELDESAHTSIGVMPRSYSNKR